MEQLKNSIRKMDTDIIRESVITIGGGHVGQDARMVRAALIDIYIERTSEAAGDRLMDFIGL